MSNLNPQVNYGFALVPEADQYILANCSVPTVLLSHPRIQDLPTDNDSLARCDIVVANGSITEVYAPGKVDQQCPVVDVEGGCVFPTFVDLHTHIGASMRVLYVMSSLRLSQTSQLIGGPLYWNSFMKCRQGPHMRTEQEPDRQSDGS